MKNNNECNNGVRCNVNECVYNEKGCSCNKEVIDVSIGDGEKMPNGLQKHFCKSFISKENKCDCHPCDCHAQANVEADEEYFADIHSPYNKPYDED